MSTPIQFPNYPQNQPLCSASDVNNLLFNVFGINNVPAGLMTSAIASANSYLESQCNRPFSPRRIIVKLDGNNKSRMVLPRYPVININKLEVYYAYPLGLMRVSTDSDLVQDRTCGIIGFPSASLYPFYEPLAYQFAKANMNVKVDYWLGWTQDVYGDVLTSTAPTSAIIARTNYAFNSPGVVKQAINTVVPGQDQPEYGPTVYVNGVKQINTTYILPTAPVANSNAVWQINSDNLVYVVNTDANGIKSITFNTPLQPSDVVTADYAHWFIPADVVDASAKYAAITILNAIAAGGTGAAGMGGSTRVMYDGFQVQYNDRGQYGPQIQSWEDEVARVVKSYRQMLLAVGGGYSSAKAW